MNETLKKAQGVRGLTIGDLAARTGVTPATLRVWEQRYGFPVPDRLPSGHRRFRESDVPVVRDVVRRRDEGTRLDVAVAQAVERAQAEGPGAADGSTLSVYAEMRRLHPSLQTYRLRKGTLKALSWAIEDEFCAKASRPHLFGAFQRDEFYRPARSRWRELARVARSAHVFVDERPGGSVTTPAGGPVEVPLPADAPMAREWVVVCDSAELPAALSAWELPGQGDVADDDRVFESVWSVEPAAVRDAARVCATLARLQGAPDAPRVLFELAEPAGAGVADLATVTTLFNRVVAYVDAAPRGA